eukprot:Selendium_serpulae@DN2151_c0_g1_i3.p1
MNDYRTREYNGGEEFRCVEQMALSIGAMQTGVLGMVAVLARLRRQLVKAKRQQRHFLEVIRKMRILWKIKKPYYAPHVVNSINEVFPFRSEVFAEIAAIPAGGWAPSLPSRTSFGSFVPGRPAPRHELSSSLAALPGAHPTNSQSSGAAQGHQPLSYDLPDSIAAPVAAQRTTFDSPVATIYVIDDGDDDGDGASNIAKKKKKKKKKKYSALI